MTTDFTTWPILADIEHAAGLRHLSQTEPTLTRIAVRGLIRRAEHWLLIYSRVNGDYKFPGGGLQPGETYAHALAREVQEEGGVQLTAIGEPVGRAVEYWPAEEPGYAVFQMTSLYVACAVAGEFTGQTLDDYERDLEFEPRWVTLATALHANHIVLRSTTRPIPRWTQRETRVLEQLQAGLRFPPVSRM